MREIAAVVTIRKFGEPEPERSKIVGVEAIRLVEELRRTMREITGDPDLPIAKVVTKRRFDGRTK